MFRKFAILLVIFLCPRLYAGYVDIDLAITQSGFSTTSDYNVTRSNNSLAIFAQVTKAEATSGFMVGWHISSLTNKDEFTGLIDQTVTSNDMGPAARWFFDKNLLYSATFVYGLVCKGNYKSATVNEAITGTSQLIKLSAEGRISDQFLIGISLNSYTANYYSSLTNSIQTDISYKNSWIYPSLTLSFKF